MTDHIIYIVCDHYKVSVKKSRRISKVWGLYAFFIRRHFGYSLRETGLLVKKHWNSVKRAEDKIAFGIKHYDDVRIEFEEVEDKILKQLGLVSRRDTFNDLLDRSIEDDEQRYQWRFQYQTGKKT